MRRFNTQIVEELQTRLLNDGKRSVKDPKKATGGKKPASVNRYLAVLRHMFTKAVEWELVPEEVLKKIRRAKNLKENNRRTRFLSTEEVAALIAACAPHLRPVVVFALNTGCRMEEILSLEWEKHVDLRHGYITLEKTKNDERRQIPINQTLRETLQGIVRRVDSPYVFIGDNGKRMRHIRKAFLGALRRAGIKDFRFHDLRHTFASLLVMNGVDLATVQYLMGHKDLRMTLRYSHLSPSHKIGAISVLDNVYGIKKFSAQFSAQASRFGTISEVPAPVTH